MDVLQERWDEVDWLAAFKSSRLLVPCTARTDLVSQYKNTLEDDVINSIISPVGPCMFYSNETTAEGSLWWCWYVTGNNNMQVGFVLQSSVDAFRNTRGQLPASKCDVLFRENGNVDGFGFKAESTMGGRISLAGLGDGYFEVYVNPFQQVAYVRTSKVLQRISLKSYQNQGPLVLACTTWDTNECHRVTETPFQVPLEHLCQVEAGQHSTFPEVNQVRELGVPKAEDAENLKLRAAAKQFKQEGGTAVKTEELYSSGFYP